MSLLLIVLLQVVAGDPAPATAPPAQQAAPPAAAAQQAAEEEPEVRCRRRAITGERLARRVCQTVDPDRDQSVADGVRYLQGNGASSQASVLSGSP